MGFLLKFFVKLISRSHLDQILISKFTQQYLDLYKILCIKSDIQTQTQTQTISQMNSSINFQVSTVRYCKS